MATFNYTAMRRGRSEEEVVVIEDEERPRQKRRVSSPESQSKLGSMIDLTGCLVLDEDDYMSDETLESSFKHLFPPSKHGKKKAPKQQSASIPKETKVELELHILQCGSTKVTPGKSVELDSGEFLRVQDIRNILTLRTVDNHILNSENILTGKLFKRARELNYLKHDFNEVAMIEVEAEANSNEVKGIVKLVVTNAPKPHFRGRGWLICRWIWDVSTDSKHEGIIRRVSEHEADENYKFQDSHLRDLWRKAKVEAYEKEMAERKAMQEMIAKKKAEELKVMMEHAVDLTGGDRIEPSIIHIEDTAITLDLTKQNSENLEIEDMEIVMEACPVPKNLPRTFSNQTSSLPSQKANNSVKPLISNHYESLKTASTYTHSFNTKHPQLQCIQDLNKSAALKERVNQLNISPAHQNRQKQGKLDFSVTKKLALTSTDTHAIKNHSVKDKVEKVVSSPPSNKSTTLTLPFRPKYPKASISAAPSSKPSNSKTKPTSPDLTVLWSQELRGALQARPESVIARIVTRKPTVEKNSANSTVVLVPDEDDEITPLYNLRRQEMFALPSTPKKNLDGLWLDLTGEDAITKKGKAQPDEDMVISLEVPPDSPQVKSVAAASPPSKTATAISSTIIPTVPLSPPGPKAPRNTYTLGDAFCGGGGASCGARLAGFRIRWGVDHNDAAISTYRANFPEATSYHASIDDFLTTTDSTVVDVAHLSPPCQPYSPAHTIAGKNDESNQAALFAIGDTLRHCRPRMATLEQTPGILHHDGYFLGMIRQFTDLEFSVTFKILKGVEYGLPQDRKRLFVMAAGPGESLPSFPPPTHSPLNPPPPPLLPAATLAAAISPIPPNATEHNFRPFTIPRPPYNADRYFRYTIMAGGGEYDAHPSGLRSFTVRELSCIQGFPMDYQFVGGYMQKKSQVGNAVPPILGRKVMEMVWKALERTDEELSRRRREGGGGGGGAGSAFALPPAAVVNVDDDDDDDEGDEGGLDRGAGGVGGVGGVGGDDDVIFAY